MTWQTRAICPGDDRFTSTDPRDQAEAVAICGNCPVMAECLAWAKTEDLEGVAGGRVWKGKKSTAGSSGNRPAKYHHWNATDMRLAHTRFAGGDRTPWAVEGERAYNAWRKRTTRKPRAA
jgi:hypothetical protein